MNARNVQSESSAEGDLSPRLVPAIARHSAYRCARIADTRSKLTERETRASLGCRKEVVAFKFGGTSLLGAARMLHAAELVKPVAQTSSVVVVVSAMKGVTDKLLAIAQLLADRQNFRARVEAELVLRVHHDALCELGLENASTIVFRANSIHSAAICCTPFPRANPSSHRPNFSIGSHPSASG